MKAYTDITDPRVVKALAHPIRAQILGALEDRVASPNQLSRELGVSLGSVSYHVHRLVDLGFLKLVKRIPRRGAIEHYYTLIMRPRITDAAWGEVPPIVKRAMIGATLEKVARHVNAAADTGGFDVADAHLTRNLLTVDEQGWRALARELDAMNERFAQIVQESTERLEGGGAAVDATVVLMLFESAPAGAPPPPAAPPAAGAVGLHHRQGRLAPPNARPRA
jgi:DNA-binding transcriptional ArsR family regulator